MTDSLIKLHKSVRFWLSKKGIIKHKYFTPFDYEVYYAAKRGYLKATLYVVIGFTLGLLF